MPELYRAAAARADCHFPLLLTTCHPLAATWPAAAAAAPPPAAGPAPVAAAAPNGGQKPQSFKSTGGLHSDGG